MSITSPILTEVAEVNAKPSHSEELLRRSFSLFEKTKDLNAFISLERETTKCEVSSGGKLAGIPIAIKDNILVKGERATAGSKILENYVAPYDATVITRLREAGATLFGKTNLDEFGMGSSTENSFFGVVKNPLDPARVAGGSSGGSAAAVATDTVRASLGTDTGGSVRQPASFCGIYGLKPTYSRVSRYGVIAFASSLDQVGIFAKDPLDCGAVLGTIAGQCAFDQTSSAEPVPDYVAAISAQFTSGSLQGKRFGFIKFKELSPDLEALMAANRRIIESLGGETIDIEIPLLDSSLATYYILSPAEASSNLARYDGIRYGTRAAGKSLEDVYLTTRTEGFGSEVKRRIMIGNFVLSSGYYDAYYGKAQKIRTLLVNQYREAFKSVDILITPTAPSEAFKIGEKTSDPLQMYLSDVFTVPVSLAGLPALSLPLHTVNGLPIGSQYIAPHFHEAEILGIAKLIHDKIGINKPLH